MSFDLNRRDLLKSVLALTAGLMAPATARAAEGTAAAPGALASVPATQPAHDKFGDLLPQRKLGRTGAWVTMLGIGGSHIGRMSEDEAQKTIETAIAGGVRFFDTAVVYQNGGSESRLGRLLTPKYRDVVFLMTKTRAPDAATARKHLDESLARLKTDYLDLWQMHEYLTVDDVNTRLDQKALDVFIEAKEKGKVKHIGFTGHVTPDTHLRMLERMKPLNDPLETCQMPINVADPSYSSFILKVLPELVKRGYGVCAMKTLAGGGFGGRNAKGPIVPDRLSVADALHFVWSLPVSVLISGPDNAAQFKNTLEIARSYSGMTDDQRNALIQKIADSAGRGTEYYKA